MNHYLPYLGIVIAAAGLGSYFTNTGIRSKAYTSLKKPSWQPPGYVIGIVWTVIYLLYSYSWSKVQVPLIHGLFGINMILNVLWCYVFFYLGEFSLALAVLMALIGTLVLQIITFYKYDMLATLLLIPYLLWCCFAAFINYTLIKIN